jgi:chlorophyllide a reductase subunit Y
MCPAFGSLRVGLRMRRVATILSGSACCVYGLTFTSHFYGARRTVGYVPFNSETLVTGKLFEDIRDAVYETAKPEDYDAVVITNLCVPTASGVPLELLPKQINGVRIIGIDVPGFGVPTHAEAKDVLAGAMLRYAGCGGRRPAPRRAAAQTGRGRAHRPRWSASSSRPDPMGIGACSRRWAWPRPQTPRGMARPLCALTASWSARCIPSTPPHPEFRAAGGPRRLGPGGREGPRLAGGHGPARPCAAAGERQGAPLPASRAALAAPIRPASHVSGYEGRSCWLRACWRAGAEVPLCRHRPARAPMERPTAMAERARRTCSTAPA